ncbi:MAG: hypothetical protein K1060chlam5_01125 [Candidatus Anoxychlamydiales bacterium]|nr:hypothetical protein [Candidatus Anoxychlamydiales bacterium]
MNYTREPIIETVISPKEGCKLAVRNTKNMGEEYFVDAIEIVSFSNAVFYRSKERPKEFLVPVSDFEVIEVKETKMVLKNVSIDRSIKIASSSAPTKEEETKSRRRKIIRKPNKNIEPPKNQIKEMVKGGEQDEETKVSSSTIRKIFPPPKTLIKEKLNHYKGNEQVEKHISQEIVSSKEEKKIEKKEIEENVIDLEREKIKKELIDKISEEIKSSEEEK